MGLQPIPFSRSGTCPGLSGPPKSRPSSIIKRENPPRVNLPIAERNEKSVFPHPLRRRRLQLTDLGFSYSRRVTSCCLRCNSLAASCCFVRCASLAVSSCLCCKSLVASTLIASMLSLACWNPVSVCFSAIWVRLSQTAILCAASEAAGPLTARTAQNMTKTDTTESRTHRFFSVITHHSALLGTTPASCRQTVSHSPLGRAPRPE